nr:uncharacterized protein CTRU02_03727 [Colletotrichum truncatum]KAF6796749.1 hypothetical protein CTRU02_03727 [Colletotrichum truncatum]
MNKAMIKQLKRKRHKQPTARDPGTRCSFRPKAAPRNLKEEQDPGERGWLQIVSRNPMKKEDLGNRKVGRRQVSPRNTTTTHTTARSYDLQVITAMYSLQPHFGGLANSWPS